MDMFGDKAANKNKQLQIQQDPQAEKQTAVAGGQKAVQVKQEKGQAQEENKT